MLNLWNWLFNIEDEQIDNYFDIPSPDLVKGVPFETATRPAGCVNGTTADRLERHGLRLVHLHPNAFTGGLRRHTSVVYRPRQDSAHVLEVATAVCSDLDCFTKKEGAKLALDRFLEGQTIKLPPRWGVDNDLTLLHFVFGG